MSNEKIILECSKEIGRIMDNYWPSCDKAYFQGVYADSGDLISVDVFFEKDKLLLKKNLVTYFDLIDCHQPRSIDDQKDLMKSLMAQFTTFAKAFDENFEECFSVAEITLIKDDGSRHIRVRFNYDQNVLDNYEGGAHELHQRYFESIKFKLNKKN